MPGSSSPVYHSPQFTAAIGDVSLPSHEEKCPFRIVQCVHPQCGLELRLEEFATHIRECAHRRVKCPNGAQAACLISVAHTYAHAQDKKFVCD